MIEVIEDSANIINSDDFVFIDNCNSYVKEYNTIQEAISHNKDLHVVVRFKQAFLWLKSMSKRYEKDLFEFKTIDYRSHLEEKWNVTIPEEYSNEELSSMDLVNLGELPQKNDSFEDFILKYFYDVEFSSPRFHFPMLSKLLTNYDPIRWDENSKYSLLRKIYSERIQKWKEHYSKEEEKEFIDDIAYNTSEIINELQRFKVLRSYENVAAILIPKRFKLLNKLNLNLRYINIDPSQIKSDIQQVIVHLNSLPKPDTKEKMSSFIESVSGLLIEEYKFIENLFIENPSLVSKQLISQIRLVFSELSDKLGKSISGLENLIRPERPVRVELDSEISAVKTWATDSYLPYIKWLLRNNIVDNEIYKIGDSFSEWFYTNWEDIKSDSNSLVANWIFNNANELNISDKINIVVVIDNFSWINIDLITKSFSQYGFSLRKKEPYFSMVPSETETSKKCLLSGKDEYENIDEKNYTDILNKGWVPYYEDKEFKYLPNINELIKTNLENGKTYFLNFLPIDSALHKDETVLGAEHFEHIEYLLQNLTKKLTNFIKEKDVQENTILHIISDHGSTKFNSIPQNDLDIDFFKSTKQEDPSPRFLSFSNEDFSKLPEYLKEDAFFIDKSRFGLSKNFLCARRSNTFLKYKIGTFEHGGLLPEEMIVPSLTFEHVELRLENILVTLLKNSFRYRSEEIQFEIANPNNIPVEDLKLEVTNSNVDSIGEIIEWLDPNSKCTKSIRGRFKKADKVDETTLLFISLKFRINDQFFVQDHKININMTSMLELKDSSMFDL
ncbi:MAG: hypothetical protein H6609_16990 [Ignavibacteriales bacterium]|nr:hypothetical protein [Ignavibacteriales bacterium]